MVVHPAPGHWSGTFVNALLGHCQNLAPGDDPLRPGIVHRLDKDTSGVLLLARTAKRTSRPLLNNADPRGTLERLLAIREPVYAEADLVLESVDGPHEKSVEQVVAALLDSGLMLQEAAP